MSLGAWSIPPRPFHRALTGWRMPRYDRVFLAAQVLMVLIIVGYEAADAAGVPWPLNSQEFAPVALFVIPMIYVARGFGPLGAFATIAWVAGLVMLQIGLQRQGLNRWADDLQVAIIGTVAVFVGYRVQREMLIRRRVEDTHEALQTSEARYRALFEQSQTATLIATRDGRVREANAAAHALLGVNGHDVIGHTLADLLGESGSAHVRAGRPPQIITRADTKGVELLLRPVCTFAGANVLQIVLQDVTEEQQRRRRLDAYAAYVLQGQEEERRRIARELHDEPVQDLVYLCRRLDLLPHRDALPADAIASLEETRQLTEQIARGLRELARGLRPPSLDDLGLVASLRHLLATFEERTGVAASLQVDGDERRLSPASELGLFRIAQEALRNVERHAAARHAVVGIVFNGCVQLTVRDDGIGFAIPPQANGSVGAGLGLLGMQERTELLGGRFAISSLVGEGATVRVTIA